MNENCYCYWLMGFFELSNTIEINKKQIELIKSHLDIVEKKEYYFCNWLEEYLNKDNLISIDLIKEKLIEEFKNRIDISYPKELWSELSRVHDEE